MSLIPTRRHVLATTATAILAFMIVVPTVLHLVNPAFGQGVGPQGGYGYTPPEIVYTPPSSPPPSPPSSPSPAPSEPPASTPPTPSTPPPQQPTPAQPTSETPTPTTPTPQQSSSTPPPAEPEPTVITTDVGAITPGTPVTIDLRPAETLEPASIGIFNTITANPSVLQTDTKVVADLVADPAALKSLVADKASTEALLSTSAAVEQILASPQALAAITSNAEAAAAFLQTDEVQAKLADDAELREQLTTAVLDQQHVTSISLKSSAAGSNVKLEVKEFLPNSKDQTAITTLGDADLAHIVIKVAAPKNVGSAPPSGTTAAEAATETLYTPLKVLDISVSGVPHGSVGATVQFTVTQAELDLMGLTAADITLLHQVNGAWVELPTQLLSHVGATYTFEAETPSFSYFAVAGRTAPAGVTAEGMSALAITGIVVAVVAVLVVVGVIVSRRRQG